MPMAEYTLKLYSPLRIECAVPYEPPWILSDDYRLLTDSEKPLCKDEVAEAMQRCLSAAEKKNGLMVRCCPNDTIKRKVLSAFPGVAVYNGILTAVLTCRCSDPLTVYEQKRLADWWKNECRSGYGRELDERFSFTGNCGAIQKAISRRNDCDARCDAG